MMSLFRRKSLTTISNTSSPLRRCLTAFDLTLLGIGAIIGAGVFVLTGVAAATKAGPAVNISFILAGITALLSALCYTELATSVGGSGSAYNYTYVSMGELIAWIIGWTLVLEYMMVVSSVAVGWSGYFSNMLQALHIHFPENLSKTPLEGGTIDLPAMTVIILLTALLCMGIKQSAIFNSIMVFVKLCIVVIFVTIASMHVDSNNWQVFFPFGLDGVVKGAAIVFYAYIGFDALSTAAEETINPQRNIPIGIIASLSICTLIYVLVSTLLTGIANYQILNTSSPVSYALLKIGYPLTAAIIAVGAIAGLMTVMLVMFYGLTRILFAISRDGLLPAIFSKVNKKTQTPIAVILFMGIIIAIIAGFVSLDKLAELVNIGTLTAFVFVCANVIVLRFTQPDLARPFKLPWNPVIPILGILLCIYLMLNLTSATWWYFLIWMFMGLGIYFIYSKKNSHLSQQISNLSNLIQDS